MVRGTHLDKPGTLRRFKIIISNAISLRNIILWVTCLTAQKNNVFADKMDTVTPPINKSAFFMKAFLPSSYTSI